MHFDWQQIISLVIVSVAVVLLLRSRLRKRKTAQISACGRHCSGCTAVTLFKNAQKKSIPCE